MNEQLHAFLEEMLRNICKGFDYAEKSTNQISSYHGPIKLIQIDTRGKEFITIATHQHGNHLHVMLIDKPLEEIGATTTPLVIFTFKLGKNSYSRVQPGRLERINFSEFGFICMKMFLAIQTFSYYKFPKFHTPSH